MSICLYVIPAKAGIQKGRNKLIILGTLKVWDSVNYLAEVQLAGSMAAYLDSVNVARNISSASMVAGRQVIVAIPEGNPADAVVIAVFTV